MVTTAPQKAKKTKKHRKHSRNKIWCNVYRLSHRREVNKLRILKKHFNRHPGDVVAGKAIDHCKMILGHH